MPLVEAHHRSTMNALSQGHILVVEDEPRLAAVLGDYLRAAAYTHEWIADGSAALASLREHRPDLVLLDLMLPGRDGIEICRELRRQSHVPVIMVTARTEELDRLLGLETGADDYICKPYSPREVVARVAAVLRRHRQVPDTTPQPSLMLDPTTHRAAFNGEDLNLTPAEFRLLGVLHGSQGRVYSRDELLDRIYDDRREVTDRAIDSHVKNLRRKLMEAGCDGACIRSIYGVGFRLEL